PAHSSYLKVARQRCLKSLFIVSGNSHCTVRLLETVKREVIGHGFGKSGMGGANALVAMGRRKDLNALTFGGMEYSSPHIRQDRIVQSILKFIDEQHLFARSD